MPKVPKMTRNVVTEDKMYLVERARNDTTCLYIIAAFATLFSIAFVLITSVAMVEIYDLSERDADLSHQIKLLKQKIRSNKESKSFLGADGRQLVQEIVNAVGNDAHADVDNLERTGHLRSDTGKREIRRERRQVVDIFGAILAAQEAVFEKHCVPHTSPCPQGSKGERGLTGDIGPQGQLGSIGLQGTTGNTGEPGPAGLKGLLGSKGIQGENGTDGVDGLRGDTGAWGDPGETGAMGEQGIKGERGDPGIKGDAGDSGPVGMNGTAGVRGSKGDHGDVGPTGTNGTQGPSGPKGDDAKTLPDGCQCYTKPAFVQPNDETIVVNASTVKLDLPCKAQGYPPPTVSITRPPRKHGRKRNYGTPVGTGTGTPVGTSGSTGSVGGTRVSSPLTNDDLGPYICEATNIFGSVKKTVTVVRLSSGK